MKLPPIARFRFQILLALAIGEIAGLIHFHGQPPFTKFVVLSLAAIMILVPLLWLESVRRIDGVFPIFILIPMAFVNLATSSRDGDTGFAIMWATILLLVVTMVLIRIYIEFRRGKRTLGGRA